jgi:hypothetical protein
MNHRMTINELGEGTTQAVCSCGWRSERFGVEKDTGTMDALQRAKDAADLHEWDAGMSWTSHRSPLLRSGALPDDLDVRGHTDQCRPFCV